MKISQRAHAIAPFLAMEFGKQAAALEAAGHHVVKMNIGEPDFGAPPAVVQAMHGFLEARHMAYTAALGISSLREAIAEHYRTAYGVDVSPERIVVTAGASAALLLVTAALVDAGDEVLVGDPSYPCNRHFLDSFGARVKLIPTDASMRFQLNSDSVRDHWSAKTQGLMVATPSNPTGTSVPPAELAAICQWARERNAWRIVDEIYLGLSDRDAAGRRAPTVLAVDPDAIVINSFSKYFGMTGWRLGWCVVPTELVPAIERLAQNYYICPSSPTQYAAVQCFTEESIAVCESRRVELGRRRSLVLEGLQQIGLSVPVPPDGAFYVYFNVRDTGLDAMTFCRRAVTEAHVALTPGADFGKCSAQDHVRLSYATSSSELSEGLRRLEVFVSKLRG
jgi:aspartate/methionine/tyrosine aminotransferase